MAIISAHSQGINEISTFADDVCRAVCKIVNDHKNITYNNFATDSISTEIKDIMNIIFKFLDRKISFLDKVDNKHNMKSHWY